MGEINLYRRVLLRSHGIGEIVLRELLSNLIDVFDAHRIRLGQARHVSILILVYFS